MALKKEESELLLLLLTLMRSMNMRMNVPWKDYKTEPILLKRISGDINEEVDTHNRMLDRTDNDMDSSRGILSGTMDRFKTVFETKSSRRMLTLVLAFVGLLYYLTR